MLIRAVLLFLLFMVVLGMVQKALRPKGRLSQRSALDRLRCPVCKRVHLGGAQGPCGRDDCGEK